jgi:hypothetical protein
MERVIAELEGRQNHKEGLRDACRENRIPVAVLSGLTVAKMRLFSQRTLRQYNHFNPAMQETPGRPPTAGSKTSSDCSTGL